MKNHNWKKDNKKCSDCGLIKTGSKRFPYYTVDGNALRYIPLCEDERLTEELLAQLGFTSHSKSGGTRWSRWVDQKNKWFDLNQPEDDNGDLQDIFIFDHFLEVERLSQLEYIYLEDTNLSLRNQS